MRRSFAALTIDAEADELVHVAVHSSPKVPLANAVVGFRSAFFIFLCLGEEAESNGSRPSVLVRLLAATRRHRSRAAVTPLLTETQVRSCYIVEFSAVFALFEV